MPTTNSSNVKAAGEGVVTFAGTKGGYGYTVDIKHKNGETTRYAHLSEINTFVGDPVRQGDSIGLSGGKKGSPGSGTSTGPHLHFETRDAKGNPIDPVGRLKQKNKVAAPVKSRTSNRNSSESSATVNSSTYTPGGGGMNAGEIDSRGNRLTRNDYAIAIPGQNRVKDQIPYGSTEYVGNINRLSDRDTVVGKKKLEQETNLYNQQDDGDRTKLITQILQNRNQL